MSYDTPEEVLKRGLRDMKDAWAAFHDEIGRRTRKGDSHKKKAIIILRDVQYPQRSAQSKRKLSHAHCWEKLHHSYRNKVLKLVFWKRKS